jgi:hypothetical protein
LGINKGKGVRNSSYEIKILGEDGKINIYELADHIWLDGIYIKSSSPMIENVFTRTYTSSSSEAINTFYYQLLRYKVQNNKITVIDTENNSYLGQIPDSFTAQVDYGFLEDDMDNNNKLRPFTQNPQRKRYISSRQFGDLFIVSESAPVFVVPDTLENTDKEYIYEDKDFEVITASALRNNYTLNIKGYDVSKVGVANALVLYGSMKDADFYSAVAVIDRVVNTLDEEGNTTYKLYYWNMDGRFYTILMDEDAYHFAKTNPPVAGDVIYYTTSRGKINSYNYYLKYNDVFPNDQYDPSKFIPTNSDGAEVTTLMGIVQEKEGAIVNFKDKNDVNRIIALDRGRIILFDCKSKQIRPATIDNVVAQGNGVRNPSIVFVKRSGYYNAHVTVIYNTEGGM